MGALAILTPMSLVVSQETPSAPVEPEWKFKSKAAVDAKKRYDQALAEHKLAYQKAAAEAGKALLTDLAAAQKEATQTGDLDEAVAIRSAIEQAETIGIGKENAIPSGTSQLTYLTVLDENIVSIDKRIGFGKCGSLYKPEVTISVGGKPSPRGLGMHAISKDTVAVDYNIQGKYKLFQGAVAIDDCAVKDGGNKSQLVFKVFGDGKLLWTSDPVRIPGRSSAFKIPVAGVKTLKLSVTCPGDAWAAKSVWIEPRLE